MISQADWERMPEPIMRNLWILIFILLTVIVVWLLWPGSEYQIDLTASPVHPGTTENPHLARITLSNPSRHEKHLETAIVFSVPGTFNFNLPEGIHDFTLQIGMLPEYWGVEGGIRFTVETGSHPLLMRKRASRQLDPNRSPGDRCWNMLPVHTGSRHNVLCRVRAQFEHPVAGNQPACLAAVAPRIATGAETEPPGPFLLIVIDTLRADRLPAWGNPAITTPNLDRFARRAAQFTDASSQSNWTVQSFASLLTGRHPDHVLVKRDYAYILVDEADNLAQVFQRRGYTTSAVVNNPHLVPIMGFANGFRTHRYLQAPFREQTGQPYNTDARLVTQSAARELRLCSGQPLFMLIHYMDPHFPYAGFAPYRNQYAVPGSIDRFGWVFRDKKALAARQEDSGLSAAQQNWVRSLYDGEIAAIDEALGELFLTLRQTGMYDHALIAVTADHGEEFWEHGHLAHEWSLYQELIHVPLLVKFPGQQHFGTLNPQSAALTDLYPTFLHQAGLDIPNNLSGRILVPEKPGIAGESVPGPIAAANNLQDWQTVRLKDWKWLRRGDGEAELYNLSQDPGENHNIAALHPQRVAQLQALYLQIANPDLHVATADTAESILAQPDEELRKSLEMLGYVR